MCEIVRAGITLRKIQHGVCRIQWMGQQLTIESRALFVWVSCARRKGETHFDVLEAASEEQIFLQFASLIEGC
jgi:hypothetical protein